MENKSLVLYTLDEAAALGQVNVHTLKLHIQTGKAPATKIGRQWFMYLSDIYAYLAERDPEKARKFAETQELFEG